MDKLQLILLEDSPLDAELIYKTLAEGGIGCELIVVQSRTDYVKALETKTFDLILADYSLPGFDGLLALQIARRLYAEVPFIFVSGALGEELAIETLKSGATDYVLKERLGRLVPSVKRALRETKERRQRRQIEAERVQILTRLQQQAAQLHGLMDAALIMNSPRSIEEVLQAITEQARLIIGAHQSVTSMTINHNWAQSINAVSLSDKYAAWRNYDKQPEGSGIYVQVCQSNSPMRLTQAQLESHPHWQKFGKERGQHPPLRGWLAAPLVGRDGHNIGLIQLSDKYEGEFNKEDETILVQLAQMASITIENTRLYEAEQNARNQAEEANRVKDQFLAILSHELRSPLNAILGWSKILLRQEFDRDTITQGLEIIERNARLQTQLIEDLLDISRIIRGKLHLNICSVNIESVIQAALNTMRPAAQAKSIDISLKIISKPEGKDDPQTWDHENKQQVNQSFFTSTDSAVMEASPDHPLHIAGDPSRLQQVFWNLLSNAIKFTPQGGRVEVRLESYEFSVMSSQLKENSSTQNSTLKTQNSLKNSQSFAQITVTDTGKGIEPEFLPHIFEYFRQADASTTRTHGGLGLGLAIVHHLVELHGGTVMAQSPGEGQGATFTVRLPIMKTLSKPVRENISSPHFSVLQGLRILIVDDEPDAREFLAFLLKHEGATVVTASSAKEALHFLQQSQVDLLISDIGMPQIDGYTLLRKIRALTPEQGGQIPAIALTAYARESDRQEAIAAGFQKHISKPIQPEELMKIITHLTQQIEQD
jgi:signal transduction histidine kinase/DNA-binding response OmpR family regulator